MKPVQGEPWPVGRSGHAACCLNYGQDHPQLLMYGGRDNDNKVLGDMWILDADTGKCTEVRMVYTYNYNILLFNLRLSLDSRPIKIRPGTYCMVIMRMR